MKKILIAGLVVIAGFGAVLTNAVKATPPTLPVPVYVTASVLVCTAFPPCTYYRYFTNDFERNKFLLTAMPGVWRIAPAAYVPASQVAPNPGVEVSVCPAGL